MLASPVRACCCALTAFVVTIAANWANAEDAGEHVVRIEEHWSVAVGGPDTDRCAPQITMVMSPIESTACDYFMVTLNCHGMPYFCPGGMEVQHWHGGDWIESDHFCSNEQMHHENETVSWVQRLTLATESNTLTFEVLDGASETWGSFGSPGQLKLQTETSLTRLNDYQPAVSLNESGVSYAGNRVSSLVLNKLVWWTADGTRHEMVAPIDIDADLDP